MKLNPIGQAATRMARQARTGLLLAALALSGAACQQADFDNLGTNRPNGGTPVRIAATMPANDPNTRVVYDDDNLTLAWEAGDQLRVTSETNPDAPAAILDLEEGSVTGSATAIFVGSLPEGCKPPYTVEVIAPGNDNDPSLSVQKQTASGSTAHLRAHLGLRATGVETINTTSSINLQMTRAIMRFDISGLTNAATGQNIQQLTGLTWSVATNFGLDPALERTTEMELSGTPDAGIYTAYLAFDPKQMSCGESYTFKVKVDGTDDKGESQPFRAEIITKGSIAYEAGKRYTITPGGTGTDDVISWATIATATGLEELPSGDFNGENNVWLITGGGDATSDATVTANVRTAILGLIAEGVTNIDLVMPKVKAMPNNWLMSGDTDYSEKPVLRSVSLPEATSIGERAFLKCTNLTTVIAPKAEYIGMYAFNSCSNLQSISHCTKDILENTFTGCTKLTAIDVSQVTGIGNYAFHGCTALTAIDVSQATSIGTNAFNGCKALTGIDVSQATSIGESAFNICTALTTVIAPNAMYIGPSAFNSCTKLTTINVSQAMSIGEKAFFGCTALKTIDVSQATTIGTSAFSGCTALETIDVSKATTIKGNAFQRCTVLTTIDVSKATSIGGNAFLKCSALETLSLPAATTIGASAFSGCTALTSLKLTAAGVAPDPKAFDGFTTTTCNLVLNIDQKGEVTNGNMWRDYTWANPIVYEQPLQNRQRLAADAL